MDKHCIHCYGWVVCIIKQDMLPAWYIYRKKKTTHNNHSETRTSLVRKWARKKTYKKFIACERATMGRITTLKLTLPVYINNAENFQMHIKLL